MKKITLLVLALVMMLSFAGCAKKEEAPVEEPKTEETTTEETKTEEATAEVSTAVPAEVQGSYAEEVAGRGMIEVSENTVVCDWSSSAASKAHWEIPVVYDATANTLTYDKAVMTEITFKENGEEEKTEEKYNNGTGYFEIAEGKLIWHDDMSEGSEPSTFVKQ